MWEQLIWALAPSIITGIVLAMWTRWYSKTTKKKDAAEAGRRKEARLNLNLTFATAQLSYACAMAIKRGSPNGEIEEAVETYKTALQEYRLFERGLVAEEGG